MCRPSLGISRPTNKNELSRLRNRIYRSEHKGSVPDEWFELPVTRTDAKNLKSPFYWDGKPCNRSNHISRRKTSSGGCWDCDYGDHKKRLEHDEKFREKRKQQFKSWYDDNKEEYLEEQKKKKSTEESRSWYREYEKEKRKDIDFRVAKSLRDRLYKAVSRESKSESAITLVGCTIPKLKKHLSDQFEPGMSWDNYGEWHIDHIRPCISFDLRDPEQQKECFHYTNLQPLWGEENISKGGIWDGFDPRSKNT